MRNSVGVWKLTAAVCRAGARATIPNQTAKLHAVATKAQNSFSSQKTLNDTRGEAATALNGVSGSLGSGRPRTHEKISRAKSAVEAWLNSLAEA